MKRTQASADSLMEYTRMLKRNDVNVVTSVNLNIENSLYVYLHKSSIELTGKSAY